MEVPVAMVLDGDNIETEGQGLVEVREGCLVSLGGD